MPPVCETIADWIVESENAIAFTGAGASTESGIPDFRSPGGVWSRTQPVYFDDFLKSGEARLEYWRQKAETHKDFVQAEPNVTHRALARWESLGKFKGVVTQNIDGLHQIAGSQNVLELHGTAREVSCLDCEARFDAGEMVAKFNGSGEVPLCPKCGGITKHATISFGQGLRADVLQDSFQWAREADLCLAMGSSLVVSPANQIPTATAQNGGRLVIINREETPLDGYADLVIHSALGEVMAGIDSLLNERL